MVKVVGVRFRKAGKIYFFAPEEIQVELNDNVVVETSRGVEFGTVVLGEREVDETAMPTPVKPIIRKATLGDIKKNGKNHELEEKALITCEEKVREHKLPMKLIDVNYTFDQTKIIFYFSSESRVDFRELVKDLAAIFRARIELRQIGVRDEAKMLGGYSTCGRELCCHSVLGDFHPVSIKMAKQQNLSLNPGKISGVCGRLMCCLQYEYDENETSENSAKRRKPCNHDCHSCCTQCTDRPEPEKVVELDIDEAISEELEEELEFLEKQEQAMAGALEMEAEVATPNKAKPKPRPRPRPKQQSKPRQGRETRTKPQPKKEQPSEANHSQE